MDLWVTRIAPKCTEIWSEKVPDLSLLGPIWPILGTNLVTQNHRLNIAIIVRHDRWPSVCTFVSVCLSVCQSVLLSVCLAVCLSVCLSVSPTIRHPFDHTNLAIHIIIAFFGLIFQRKKKECIHIIKLMYFRLYYWFNIYCFVRLMNIYI